jgi:hypothetical protein
MPDSEARTGPPDSEDRAAREPPEDRAAREAGPPEVRELSFRIGPGAEPARAADGQPPGNRRPSPTPLR